MSQLNPRTTTKEFFGVTGALCISIGLPIITVLLNQMSSPSYHLEGINLRVEKVLDIPPLGEVFFNAQLWCYYLVWFFTLMVLDLILPGKTMDGVKLRDNTALKYKINGVALSAVFVLVLAVRFQLTNGALPEFQWLYAHQVELCLISIWFSIGMATFVYIGSFIPLTGVNGVNTKERVLALGGNSGNAIFDWFIGRELNPRIGSWDIKLFCELRPGMLLWLAINLSCLHHNWLQTGTVNDALLLVNVLQAFYIFDGVLNEEGCLTMMDITTDGFGFMLAFGDLTWVPFTYCLQARYLTVSPITLGPVWSGAIVALMALGYYIFHSSNNQKSHFRQGKLPHLKSIQTERGTKLLCDGWWGMSQHINYLGDWLISLSWCLTTGFQTPLTYYYSIYFAVLLLHRQTRDEEKCRNKYGKSWEEYERRVPYKIIPYVY